MRRIMILLLLAALLAGCGRREQERQAGTEMLPTAAIWSESSVVAMDTLRSRYSGLRKASPSL